MDKQKKSQWSRANQNIFEEFALELQEYGENGVLPAHVDQDMRYCMELQRERLKQKNLKIRYGFTPRGAFAEASSSGRSWQDEHYYSQMEYRSCTTKKEVFQGRKRLFQSEKSDLFYQIITDAQDMAVVETDLYACPNCGASSQIKVLQKGCPYCGTFFKMSELFPKVTSFYFVDDMPTGKDEIIGGIKKFVKPCCIVLFIIYMIAGLAITESILGKVLALIVSAIAAAIGGFLGGYFLWALSLMCKALFKVGEVLPVFVDTVGSNNRFVEQMQKYSGEFSYEYFCNKAVSLLKMIIFSENAQELPIYQGKPLGERFKNIVDATYVGATALESFQVQGDDCHVEIGIYMDNLYEERGSICKKRDLITVTLRRNIMKPINYHFSIRNIQCGSCNYSFDATKQRNCPGCGTRYEVGDADWIVTEVRL